MIIKTAPPTHRHPPAFAGANVKRGTAPAATDTDFSGRVTSSTFVVQSRAVAVTLPKTRFARYIGRVGGLAVAMGIGIAVAHSPGVACASPSKPHGASTDRGPDATGAGATNTKTTARSATTSHANSAAPSAPTRTSDPSSKLVLGGVDPPTVVTSTSGPIFGVQLPGQGRQSSAPGLSVVVPPAEPPAIQARGGAAETGDVPAAEVGEPARSTHSRPTAAAPGDLSGNANSPSAMAPSVPATGHMPSVNTAVDTSTIDNPTSQSSTPAVSAVTGSSTLSAPQPSTVITAGSDPASAPLAAAARSNPTLSGALAVAGHVLAPSGPNAPTDGPLGWVMVAVSRRQAVPSTGLIQGANAGLAATSVKTSASSSVVDSTAVLQAMFDQLKPGATLYIPPGTYYHSGDLYIRVPNVHIYGDDSTFVATNPSTSALMIQASGVTVQDLLLQGPGGSLPQGGPSAAGLVVGYNGVTVQHVSIVGPAGLGIYLPGATNFVLDTVYVANTGSDGIQITGGANHGQLNNVRVQNTGDDSIAMVSYSTDQAPVSDIVVNSPVVINSTQTRGIAVVGGQNITFNNIFVQSTALSGFFVGSQVFSDNQGGTLSTMSVSGVTLNGGTIIGANWATGLPLGAITVLNQNPNATVSNVTISGVSIVNPYTPYFNIGNATLDGGGPISNIAYSNISITENPTRPIIYSNVPGSYTATGFTMNGAPIVVT